MVIYSVAVKHKGIHYLCEPLQGGWKCGRCGRGNIWARLRDKCRVCKAVVVEVRREIEDVPYRPEPPSPYDLLDGTGWPFL